MCFAVPGTPLIKNCKVCILAGGLSLRMGRDKSRLRLGRRTMLQHIRTVALATALPVRVIRQDAVPRCGPLGGIYTALISSNSDSALFLACDMPFVTAELLEWLLGKARNKQAIFIRTRGKAGFPFVLPRMASSKVTEQIQNSQFSLQALADALNAKLVPPPRRFARHLRNVNTPAEWKTALRSWRKGTIAERAKSSSGDQRTVLTTVTGRVQPS
jgi:molybdopterin-guanine dinucleotide biosynthesis protein A